MCDIMCKYCDTVCKIGHYSDCIGGIGNIVVQMLYYSILYEYIKLLHVLIYIYHNICVSVTLIPYYVSYR